MALKTYIGTFEEGVDVAIMGNSFGIVKPGEAIVVPDELAAQASWGEDIWEDTPPELMSSSRSARKDDGPDAKSASRKDGDH